MEPRVETAISATDNAQGATKAEKQDADLFGTVGPGINILGEGARVRLNFNGSVQYNKYLQESDLDDASGNAFGIGRVELFEDRFFVDGNVNYRQQLIDRTASGSTDNARIDSENTTDRFDYSISPYYLERFGGWVETQTRGVFGQTLFDPLGRGDTRASSNATTVGLSQSVASGARFTSFFWNVTGEVNRSIRDDDDNTYFQVQRVTGDTEYVINRTWALLGTVGIEEYKDTGSTVPDGYNGVFWLVGARWTPGPRTSLSARVGRRFGGMSYAAEGSYILGPTTTISLSVDDTATVGQARNGVNFFNMLVENEDGVIIDETTGLPADPNDPNDDLTNGDAITRNRTINLSLTGSTERNDFSFFTFFTQRDTEATGREARISGLGGRFKRRLTPLLDWNVAARTSYTDDDAIANTYLTTNLGTSFDYRFSDSLTGSVEYSLFDRRSDDETNERQENLVSVRLVKFF
ncbi:hypothetical protein OCH7691_03156 [Oceanibacterium hippocampi]|uniref:TIGR03016 family PEP-CTERM system-associated outer membrane protein n=1 Tax=Oceanibacterium hippocampi TaxID=745714 RepID=A0A1Y5TSF6_9PROT|nr:hypothetical protein OCH7691_03156 [Oceanibacterium hippocampi]